MDEEDFFKDYPAPSEATSESGPAIQLGLGPEPVPAEGAAHANGTFEIGGPPPEEDVPGDEPSETAESTEECAAVKEWRIAFAKGLEEKVLNERQVKAERAQRARETLARMHASWENKCKDAAESNKKKESEFLRERDGLIARMSKPGEPPAWGVIPELVDMSGKYKEGARDTSRMRQVLLKMKTY